MSNLTDYARFEGDTCIRCGKGKYRLTLPSSKQSLMCNNLDCAHGVEIAEPAWIIPVEKRLDKLEELAETTKMLIEEFKYHTHGIHERERTLVPTINIYKEELANAG